MTMILHRGRPVEILARDTDPTASVWIAYLDDPDRDAHVDPAELEEVLPVLEKIAHGCLFLDTLADRGSDDLDFHDVHVGGIREALDRAYQAGRDAGIAEARRA